MRGWEAMAFPYPGTEGERRNESCYPLEGVRCWGEGKAFWCSLAAVWNKAWIFPGLCFPFRRHYLY